MTADSRANDHATSWRIAATELLLAALFGIITTLAVYAGFGGGGQVEHVPIIMRKMDPSYLSNDFFTNAAFGSIARDGYARLLAALCGTPNDLPGVMAWLCLVSNTAISLCTCVLGWQLYPSRRGAGAVAAALAMSVTTFELGWRETVFLSYLMPALLALPLAMGAVMLAMRERPIAAVATCALAALVHPLIGLETGGLVLFAWLVSAIVDGRGMAAATRWRLSAGGVILATCAMLLWLPQHRQQSIPDDLFVHIVAHVRNPHHHLPSTFPWQDWACGGAFALACVLLARRIWTAWSIPKRWFLGSLMGAIAALCIGGWVWVEVWPTRLWTTAQVFRLLFLVRWVGLAILGGALMEPGLGVARHAIAWACALHPVSALAWAPRVRLGDPPGRANSLATRVALVLCVILCLLLWLWTGIPLLGMFMGVVALTTTMLLSRHDRRGLVGWVLAICVGALLWRYGAVHVPNPSELHTADGGVDAGLIACELGADAQDVANYGRANTPADSVFLTPPMWGQVRLLAHRAILIDYKAFIYTDAGMSGWYERLNAAYGETDARGYAAARAYDEQYRTITDHRLAELGNRYDIDYAVLYVETDSMLPVVYANDRYQIVLMP